jgi:uncharacterized membrane protein
MAESMDPAAPSAAAASAAARTDGARVAALDWLRGFVMAVMAVDHVDMTTNARHAQGDSAGWHQPAPLSPPDFLTRWCTHLCAPTFVFLAGAGIALAALRARGADAARGFDRHLTARGLVLVAIELAFLTRLFRFGDGVPLSSLLPVFLQVIYAIGVCMMLMVPLRRLPARAQTALALALLLGFEAIVDAGRAGGDPLLVKLLATGGTWSAEPVPPGRFVFDVFVLYPAVAWLPAMLLGHAFGQRLAHGGPAIATLVRWGLGALAVFLLLRLANGYGNMGLLRRDASPLEWLHCSKYPPSVTFFAMELGLAALLLAALLRADRWLLRVPRWNPLLVLGQVPLFFYLVHFLLIGALIMAGVLPDERGGSAGASWLGALVVVAVAWPLCAGYRWYKQRWRHAWTRYL